MSELNDERFHAIRAHDLHGEKCRYLDQAAVDASTSALKAILLVSGGGVVALLGLMAALASMPSANLEVVERLREPLVYFFVSCVLSVSATAIAYFVNFYYSWAVHSQTLTWKHPFVDDTPKAKRYRGVGRFLHVVAAFVGLLSIVVLALGGYKVFSTISLIPTAAAP